MAMDSKAKIELALLAALAAKTLLNMIDCGDPHLARLYLAEAVNKVRAIDAAIGRMGA